MSRPTRDFGFAVRWLVDRALSAALREVPLETITVLDPCCGDADYFAIAPEPTEADGIYVVAAFEWLAARWRERGLSSRDAATAALSQVRGLDCDSAARDRSVGVLARAVWRAGGSPGDSAAQAISVADPLLWVDGVRPAVVVLGSPPCLTCKEASLVERYRERWPASADPLRVFAVAAPMLEAFFKLATPGGFVAAHVANGFTRRAFGRGLVERVLPALDVTHVLDTSGCYIPLHGAPTLILLGRNRAPTSDTVRLVEGLRGEPSTPEDPSKGRAWSSITGHIDELGHQDEYAAVTDVPRAVLAEHPWAPQDSAHDRALLAALEGALREVARPLSLAVLGAAVAQRLPGDTDLVARIETLVREQGVPFHAALRFSPQGLDKARAAHGTQPTFTAYDFRDMRSWALRGPRDQPRERFLLYPLLAQSGRVFLVGWAGRSAAHRAEALASLLRAPSSTDPAERTAWLAGLVELLPSLPAPSEWQAFVEREASAQGLSLEALRAWEPPERPRTVRRPTLVGRTPEGKERSGE